ncbi:CDP-diacylglycerol diphosphatase [Neoasaia chiangmaiensis]|uniref:CDP-diacylglycerol pyrophosphatase n=1 Tax=Neoasaia chiangmaiensis TaxID=320497 RepID=A0A1U9KMU9_9PROT|nr:CDP-diacylglycerol diphosphatase [Neoasaia chiangmaiensis]AQS87109.1 hypothetical protein A0U93_03225 [Neoasaia chiangmaiensis]
MSRNSRLTGLAVLVGLVVAGCAAVHERDPDALWKIVHERCAIGGRPCAVYDAKAGYALLHSLEGKGQYLLMPTVRMSGIESPALLQPGTPNYFALAWLERDRVSKAYGVTLPTDALSLAINSKPGRSQDQLHIHIDCMTAETRRSLDAQDGLIGPMWSDLPQAVEGHHYRAIRLPDLDRSPFRVLADSLSSPQTEMRAHTLVVIPTHGSFILLDDAAHGLDRASGEVLQDHACRAFLPASAR